MPLARGAIRLTFENDNFAKVLVAKVTSVRLVLSLIWRGEAQHTLENQNWHLGQYCLPSFYPHLDSCICGDFTKTPRWLHVLHVS